MSDAPCNFFLTVSKRQQTDSSHLPLWAAGMLKSESKKYRPIPVFAERIALFIYRFRPLYS